MSSTLRVLHVHSGNLYGGVETMLLTIARVGPAYDMESRFALSFDERFAGELRDAGAPVRILGPARVRRPWTVWSARRRLGLLVRRERPDVAVVHSGWSQSLFGPVLQEARLPMVRWLHAIPDPKHWLERWARWTPPSLFVCNSQYTADGLRQMDPALPHVVIRPPVPPPDAMVSATRAALRAELGAPDGTCVILQAGRMEPGKGHQVLLQALAGLGDRADWVVWQAGGAQRDSELAYLGALGMMAGKLGLASRVRFLGERKDIRALIAAADVYCQPNRTPESFGISFIEALYAGLPVVTSAIGGATEIVDRSCGILLPPDDPGALGAALRELIDNRAERRALGAAGPERAAALCDPEQRVAEVREALTPGSR